MDSSSGIRLAIIRKMREGEEDGKVPFGPIVQNMRRNDVARAEGVLHPPLITYEYATIRPECWPLIWVSAFNMFLAIG